MSGYGRGWRYPKAHGWRRIFQRLNEPATYVDYAVIISAFTVIMIIILMVSA